MSDNPRDLVERLRQLAEKRDRQADCPELSHLKAAAATYRTLADALEHQNARLHPLREQLAAANITRKMVRELRGH